MIAANSALLFGPDGELVANHRKTHLFELDVPWAQAGEERRGLVSL